MSCIYKPVRNTVNKIKDELGGDLKWQKRLVVYVVAT